MPSRIFQENFLAALAGPPVNKTNCNGLTQSTQPVNSEFAFMADITRKWKKTSPTPPKAHQLSKVPRGLALEIVTDDLLSYRVLRALHFLDLRDVAA